MKAAWNKMAVTVAVIAQLIAAPALSAIPRTDYNSTIDFASFTRGIQPIESTHVIKSEDVARWIPTNMQPTDSDGQVASQIFDFGLQNLLKSPQFKNNALVRSAQKMDSLVESDMSFGGDEEGATKHVFKLRMKPTQTLAQLNYEGYISARVNYQIAHEALNVEISEKIGGNTDLVLSHADTRDDRREMLSMRWNF